ncbi:MAG: Lrp/AsnC ligand binding domain-containing protein [Candidatus Hermodarchaeota archaeon]
MKKESEHKKTAIGKTKERPKGENKLINAYILINVEIGQSASVFDEMKKVKSIKRISIVTGEFDIIARVEVDNMMKIHEVTEEIHQIPGIKATSTQMIALEVLGEEELE